MSRLALEAIAEPDTALRAEWDALAVEAGADACFCPDWVEAWRAHFGPAWAPGRRFLHLALREDDELVALLPLCLETLRVGPLPVRIARLAGSDPNYAVMRLPIRAGREVEALSAALAHLLDVERRHAVSLSPLSDLAPETAALRAVAETDPDLVLAPDGPERRHTVVALPDDFETWLASLSKSRRREYRKDLKKLSEQVALETRSTTPETVADRFAAFADLHAAQWRAAGKGGHFEDWPGSEAFYAELLERLAPQGRGGIDEHLGNGRVLSSQLRFGLGSTVCWRLIARDLDPDFAAFGLGRVGLVERVRDLIAAGVRRVEAGAGDYDYKLAYGGELVSLRRALVMRPGSRAHILSLLAFADLLNLAYYRIWFLKLVPRLGRPPRPLWKSWIRTRL